MAVTRPSALTRPYMGRVDSAATAELVDAAVAGAAGTDHRDQVTDCESILAIERGRLALSSSHSAVYSLVLSPFSTLSGGRIRRSRMQRGRRTTWACI